MRDQRRLAEDHLLQQALEEIAAPLHRPQGLCTCLIDAQGTRKSTGEAIDRCAFLRARGEVDPTQQRRRIVACAAECGAQELQEQRLEARHLAGKHRDEGTPIGVAFRLQAVEQSRVQSLHQAAQCAGAGADRVIVIGGQFERGAPNLRALLAIEVVEELGEARDQVGLGEQRIDRHANAEPRLQFVDPAADRRGVRLAFGGRRECQIAQRERDQQAVQRLARPGLLQQIEKGVPAGAIDRGVRILRGVAAGGVDQHGVLGEPPVAQPCAADAGDRALPHLLRQRETQAGVQQCRRLAGAGRTDDRVPRLLVQIAAAAAATSSAGQALS